MSNPFTENQHGEDFDKWLKQSKLDELQRFRLCDMMQMTRSLFISPLETKRVVLENVNQAR